MNTQHPLALAILALCAGFSASALAQTGTVTFNGEIQTTACTGGGEIVGGDTVTLPTLPMSHFTFQSQTAGETMFTFVLHGCAIDPNRRLKVGFWSSNATAEGRLSNPSGSNVQVELLGADTAGSSTSGQRIEVGTGAHIINVNDPGKFAATDTMAFNYFAQYYANIMPVTGGTVNIPAQWVVYY